MVNQPNEEIVREFNNLKLIQVYCKICKQNLGNFEAFNNYSRQTWTVKIKHLKRDFRLRINEEKIFCKCSNSVGKLFDFNTLEIQKKSVEIIH